jgi:predicted transposase YbfD/YdcC
MGNCGALVDVILSHPMRKTTRKPSCNPDMEPATILQYFAAVPDPRIERSRLHPLPSILVMSLIAVICGADSFVGIEQFARSKEAWLKTFLDLPNGVPSHDTLGRVFAMLEPKALAEAFRSWMAEVAKLTDGGVVAIDGKTLRRSFRRPGVGFVHMVSAWSAENRMVLGQVKTDEKSNEISAIPRLLALLNITGCTVTIDAMGCQKEIAKDIVEGGAHYMLAVKDNQPKLAADIEAVFERARHEPEALASMLFHETRNEGHGRVEVRRCWTSSVLDDVRQRDQWEQLRSIVLIESERTVNGKTTLEHRHYISSQFLLAPEQALADARSHWGIENGLHWVLDVAFREDDCRVRTGHAAENFAVIRHLAVNLLKATPGTKVGIQNRRLRAGWDESFLFAVLGAFSDAG